MDDDLGRDEEAMQADAAIDAALRDQPMMNDEDKAAETFGDFSGDENMFDDPAPSDVVMDALRPASPGSVDPQDRNFEKTINTVFSDHLQTPDGQFSPSDLPASLQHCEFEKTINTVFSNHLQTPDGQFSPPDPPEPEFLLDALYVEPELQIQKPRPQLSP